MCIVEISNRCTNYILKKKRYLPFMVCLLRTIQDQGEHLANIWLRDQLKYLAPNLMLLKAENNYSCTFFPNLLQLNHIPSKVFVNSFILQPVVDQYQQRDKPMSLPQVYFTEYLVTANKLQIFQNLSLCSGFLTPRHIIPYSYNLRKLQFGHIVKNRPLCALPEDFQRLCRLLYCLV